jgi:Cof subfamily protein (haloacid dehalogenase superfamily)
MIATDLDGTLLDGRRALSPRTVQAVRDTVAEGIDFILVTARPPRTVAPLAEVLGVEIEALCGNGTLLAAFPSGEVTLIESFDGRQAAAILRRLRPALPEAGFAFETGAEVYYEPGFGTGQVGDERRIATDDLAAVGRTLPYLIKVLARSAERNADEMVAVALHRLGHSAEVSHSGGRGLLELAPPGASKASALAWLCARRGIAAAEVAAFGDMPNDLPMLRWAGIGHAVANAHPDVLAAADAVVGHHAEDGVAAAIESLLAPRG